MKKIGIKITKDKYPHTFGGIGFHNNEAMLYPIIEKEHFNQLLGKCYREIAPGFMRTFGGYDDWTRQAMDSFCEYYERMQKITDTPIYLAAAKGKMHFSDDEKEKYCEAVADNLMYLKKNKNMKHLRYYCFSNEMSQCGWGDLMQDLPLFKKYHQMLYRAFQNRGLDIGLLATDASEYQNWDTIDWAIENMSRITEDYCLHVYDRHSIYDTSFYDFFYEKCNEVVKKAIKNDNKRLILGEIGIQKIVNEDVYLGYGNGVVYDTCRWFDDDYERTYCALMQAEMIFSAINAGVFSIAMWSYTDYPDPYSCAHSEYDGYAKKWAQCEKFVSGTTDCKYNKWGMFTWEDDGNNKPKEFYWCLAPLVKLFKKNSKVLNITCDDSMVRCCGILNRDGSISVGFVNRNKNDVEIELDSDLIKKDVRVYEYDTKNVPYNKFGDIQDFTVITQNTYVLKAESVTFFTTDYEEKTKHYVAGGKKIENKILYWNPVQDTNHCYYRVFAGDKADFIPTKENQIASTIDCSLPIENEKLYYKILSVDKYGNI